MSFPLLTTTSLSILPITARLIRISPDSRLLPSPSPSLCFLAQYPVAARCQPMKLIMQRVLQVFRQALVHGLVHGPAFGSLVGQCFLHPVPCLVELFACDNVLRDQQQTLGNIEAYAVGFSRPDAAGHLVPEQLVRPFAQVPRLGP